MDLHENGRIWAESKGEGKGSTFFVQLPLHSRNHLSSADDKHDSVLDLSRSLRNLLSEEIDGKQSEAIVLRGSSITANPIAAEGQAPVSLVVEATWKPTVLVVDDSAMNRKVEKFTFPSSLPSSLSQSPCPFQCIISPLLSHILHHLYSPLTHNPLSPVCQMLVRMLISKGFACREAEDGVEALSQLLCMSRIMSPNPSSKLVSLDQLDKSLRKTGSIKIFNKSLATSFDINHQQQFPIDAVLIDFHMPRLNGPDTIKEMRKIGFRNPIIGVSGGDKKTMEQFLQAGASNVIQKPAQSNKLVELILTGFRLIIQEGTTSLNTGPSISVTPQQELITRLQKFLDEKKTVK